MRRRHAPIDDLRLAIACLPERTRTAMLEGLDDEQIIVGAYSDRAGGVCPMLAAHRRGGRTSLIAFARSWDAFTGARRARRATRRELDVLRAELRLSLGLEPEPAPLGGLGGAVAEHQALARARRAREAAATGEVPLPSGRPARRDARGALEELERRAVSDRPPLARA